LISIDVFKEHQKSANIAPLEVTREWMDKTNDAHAYKCFPVSLSNCMGWGISFPEEISFIWDGISDSSDSHVKILKGNNYCSANRGNATISFNTGLIIKTPKGVSMVHMPVPNGFIDGAQAFTTVISTSFYDQVFPAAWKITRPNVEIVIPANTPIIALLPLSLQSIKDFEVNLYKANFPDSYYKDQKEHAKKYMEISMSGKFTNFYRDAVNYKNEKIGEHEIKSFKLQVKDHTGVINE
jgi:hypothetical protein